MIYYHHRITKFTKCFIRISEVSLPPQERIGVGAAGFGDRRARASYTDTAVTDSLEFPPYIYLARSRERNPRALGEDAGERRQSRPLGSAGRKPRPSSALHIHVATAAMNFYILAAARVKVVALSIETSRRSALGVCY